jgi:hypothetical protein
MQPADLRIDPFTWIPASARRREASALGMMILAASCIAVGILIGRGWSDVAQAPRQTVSTMPTAEVAASPRSQVGSAGHQTPSQPSLAKRGNPTEQSPLREPGDSEPKQETPPVVLLNPGTADPHESARAPRELGDNRRRIQKDTARRRDDLYRAEEQRFGSSAPDYRALRDYMLGR